MVTVKDEKNAVVEVFYRGVYPLVTSRARWPEGEIQVGERVPLVRAPGLDLK